MNGENDHAASRNSAQRRKEDVALSDFTEGKQRREGLGTDRVLRIATGMRHAHAKGRLDELACGFQEKVENAKNLIIGQLIAGKFKLVFNFVAKNCNHSDDGHRNQRKKQAIFDQGLAFFLEKKLFEHRYSPRFVLRV